MHKHVTVLAVLHIIYSGLTLIPAFIVFVILLAGGLVGDAEAMGLTASVAIVVALIIIVVGAPGVIGGLGLLKRRSWARILVLIVGCLHLLSFPLGTALGIYTIWVLVQPETKLIVDGGY
ncbi:MAG TPA: hypothetical protein VFV34_18640 [Blastocatellia bacterium]|nr:hypothetical protein [Blastocatellia bacterium]